MKTAVFLGGVLAGTVAQAAPAFAAGDLGWDPTNMAKKINSQNGEVSNAQLDQDSVNSFVTGLTTWILGIAIVIFVLRVVLTAVDRMILGDENTNNSFHIPFSYKKDMEWKEIWKKFAMQLGIALAAWLIVNLIMQVLLWVFGTVGSGNTTK